MKKYLIKGFIVVLMFFLSLFIISGVMNKGNTDMTVEMAGATYPVVYMEYAGRQINELHGYREEMEVNYMRDSITPLGSGRQISLKMNCYGRQVEELAFEVRTVDGERLIESTVIEEFIQEGDVLHASFILKDLIDSGKEYSLTLIAAMEDGEEIRYYTRTVYSDKYSVGEKLDYIVDFSAKTFDKEEARELTRYLESNAEGDNTTLGRVNIHSSFQQVTWGELQVERVTEPKIVIKELAEQTGSFLLKYYVSAEAGGSRNYYDVQEFYRVRYTPERMYLLDFDRTMNQVFSASQGAFSDNEIFVGIVGDEVELRESDGGNVVAFITGNRLYSYNVVDQKLAYLFGFYNEENQDDRALYDKHRIKLLNVDETGNVTFMVYGYMNRGRHEGNVGVSVYYYNSTVNTIEELVYLPYYKSPDLLLAEVAQLAYINRVGILYLMLDNEIYGISAIERSYEVVVSNLVEGCYQVSDSNRMVVWQKENQRYQSRELILMNLNSGEQSSIRAGYGEVIAPLGFMGDDLICGIAREEDIVRDDTGSIVFPMYRVRIQNEAEGILKEYKQDNIYVVKGEVAGNQIVLTRVSKNEEGKYEAIEDDHIVNAHTADRTANSIEVVAIDVYEKVTQIVLKNKVNKDAVVLLTPKEVLFEGGRNINISVGEEQTGRYYVYAKSGIAGIFMDESNAVNMAYNVAGVVIDDDGDCVWMRGTRSVRNQIMAITGKEATEQKSSLAVCLDTILEFEGISRNTQYMLQRGGSVYSILEDNLENAKLLDLTGCSLDAVLYYVNQDIPVLVLLEDGEAVLLIGFNEMNTVIMNPETGTVYKMGMNDTREWFELNGNRFITYISSK